MLAREKSTSLAELFSVELKFTVDTLNDWFSNTIKPKFLEPNYIKKQIFTKENPIVSSKTIRSICGFLIDVEEEDWYDIVVNREHLCLRNIYTSFELKEINIETTEKYREIVDRLFEVYPMFERALDDGDMSDEFRNFLVEDLDDCYPTLSEIKDDIHHIDIPKKIFTSKKILFSDRLIAFIYSSLIKFSRTDKIKGVPLSKILLRT